jgi:regulator of protease activity HflC (stomatin/prohibitin superfamily)
VITAIVIAVIVIFLLIFLARTVRIIPQARAAVVERLGRYHRTLTPGMAVITPFVDRVRPLIDLREQVVSFPPQPVITSDNLTVNIDTVIYFQVTNPAQATYEIANYIQAIEQLTVTTLRNVIGGMDLERTLTSRDEINTQLRVVLDEATGKWGIKVNRVELKSIDPPPSIQSAMEKQMRAERDRRAAILTAEGVKQSQILTAEGEKQSAVLRAEGDRQARILQAEGQARAIETVFCRRSPRATPTRCGSCRPRWPGRWTASRTCSATGPRRSRRRRAAGSALAPPPTKPGDRPCRPAGTPPPGHPFPHSRVNGAAGSSISGAHHRSSRGITSGSQPDQGWQRLAVEGGARTDRGHGRARVGRAHHHRRRFRPRRQRHRVWS